jgi:hypothetical protein
MGYPVSRDFLQIEKTDPLFLYFDRVIKPWEKVFGRDKCIIQLFEPRKLKTELSIFQTIFTSIGWCFDENKVKRSNIHRNSRIVSAEISDFLSYCNLKFGKKKSRMYIKLWMYHNALKSQKTDTSFTLLSEKMRDSIFAICEKSNEWVRDNYFPTSVQLFDKKIKKKKFLPVFDQSVIDSMMKKSGIHIVESRNPLLWPPRIYYYIISGVMNRFKEEQR